MKRALIAAAGFALCAATGLANAASWSVVVQPGVYGRVEIGGYVEAPRVYSTRPVMAVDDGDGDVVEEYVDTAYATAQPPVYLWVPEYQRTHWAQYCREYGAYGVPVYFVDDDWYRANVMRRNWTPEQRSWTQQQWLEQDRLARDRFERQRFEQQRYEQQRRWDSERAWRDPRQQPGGGRWQPTADGAHPGGGQPPQPSSALQAHGGPGMPAQGAGDRRGDERGQGRGERGDRDERHGRGEARGGFEHGHGGRRDR